MIGDTIAGHISIAKNQIRGLVHIGDSSVKIPSKRLMAFTAGLFAATALVAQETSRPADVLEEVVVTAQKREQDIQSVGISVAAFTGEQLRQLGVNATSQLGALTPGLMVADYNNPIITTFAVRSVSQIDFADHEESPVAVFVDGAYVPYLAAVGMSMFDLERVEVLRGPQGTLFGRNATGGVVQLITAKPSNKPEAFVDITAGQFGLFQTEGAVSGPLSDRMEARLSFSTVKHDGIFKNDAGPDKGDANSKNLRAQLRYLLNDKSDFLLSLRANRERVTSVPYVPIPVSIDPQTGLSVAGNPSAHDAFCQSYFGMVGMAGSVGCLANVPYTGNPYRISENQDGVGFRRDDKGVTGTFTWNFDALKLTSVTNYENLKKDYGPEDDDGTPLNSFFFGQTVRAWNASQEFRLEGSNKRDRWVAGVYYLAIDGDYAVKTGIYQQAPPDGLALQVDNSYSLRDSTWALFGQNEFDIMPSLTLTTGIRWTQDRKRFQFYPQCAGPGCDLFGFNSPDIVQGSGYNDSVPGAKTTRDKGNASGKIQLDWHPADKTLIYAGITRGTKAGGYNAQSTASWTIPQEIFDDEILTNYEVGFKTTSANGRLRLNGSVFFYHYSNLQVFSQAGASVFTFNVNAKVHGAELELTAAPAHGWVVGAGLSWLDSLTDPIQNVNPLTFDVRFARQELPFSPRYSANAYVRKTWDTAYGVFSMQADAKWLDHHKVELLDDPALMSPAYAVANAQASYETRDQHWRFTTFVNNVFDKEHLINGTPTASVTGSVLAIYGSPRWFGSTLSYRW